MNARRSAIVTAWFVALAGGCRVSVEALVVDATVNATCVEGGDCSVAPARVSVGHCGDDVYYDDDDGVLYVISDLPAEDIAVAVALRHLDGELPAEAANGGTTRGFVVQTGSSAAIVGLLAPERTLYTVGEDGRPIVSDTGSLQEEADGRFVFAYRVGDLEVEERHDVTVAEQRPLDLIDTGHIMASCCAAIDTGTASLWALTSLALLAGRRRRR